MLRSWVPWRVCLHSINSGPRIHALGWSWRSKSRTPKKVIHVLLFLLLLPPLKTLGQTSVSYMTQPFVSWGEGQSDLYLVVEWISISLISWLNVILGIGERGGSVVECRTPEREVRGSRPTSAVLCPWARHFTPRKYWLITQEAMAPSRHDWKIVDWDVKPQHNQPTILGIMGQCDTKIDLIKYM